MKNKALAVALCFLVLMSLAGCNKKGKDESSTISYIYEYEYESKDSTKAQSSDKSSSTQGSSSSTNSTKTSTDDNQGQTGDSPIQKTNIDYTKVPMPSREVKNKTLNNFSWREPGPATEDTKRPSTVKILKDKFGIDIKTTIAPHETYWNVLAASIASGNGPDMVELPPWNFYPRVITSDLIVPAEEFINFSSDLWKDMSNLINSYKWKNKIYFGFTGADITSWIFYNTKTFKDRGVATPRSYYEKDNWTWDTFKELCKQMTEKDDQGKTTLVAFSGDGSGLFPSTGIELVEYNRTAGYKFNLKNSKLATMMNMFYDLGEKGTKSVGSVPPTDINNGKLAMLISKPWAVYYELNSTRVAGNLEWVPLPKMDKNSPYYWGVDVYPTFGITKGSKNPEGASLFIELSKWGNLGSSICSWIPREKNAYDVMYPPVDKPFDINKQLSAEDVARTKSILNKNYPVVTTMWQSWLDTLSFPGYTMVIANGKQWSSVVESVYPGLEATLKSYFK